MKDINKIIKLRSLIEENKIDAYMVIDSDNHSSEYVNSYYQERSYISEFTGSNGVALILKNKAYCFTDGRYALQAKDELDSTVFELVVYPETMVQAIKAVLVEEGVKTVGLNGERFSTAFVEGIKEVVSVNASLDLVKDVWTTRKPLEFTNIFNIANLNKYSYMEKIERVREMLDGKSLILTDITDIAWLFNLRAMDVPTCLVFLSFAYISKDEIHLFLNKKSLSNELPLVHIHEYNEFKEFIKGIKNEEILIDKSSTNYLFYELLCENNKVVSDYTPTTILKAHKDEVEIENSRNVHIVDGLAVLKLMKYVKENKGLDELKVCEKILEFRKEDERFLGVSFETIAGFNSNGAIVHYEPTIETNKKIDSSGLLLVDSGGQYLGGTTDITRTFSIGEVTEEEKDMYTLVLKGHVDVSKLEFSEHTLGKTIDLVARQSFFDRGLDYKHGTGHGVGYMNSVHEGPVRLSLYGAKEDKHSYVEETMVSSIEPGIYLENKFGIRIENEIYCVKKNGKLAYETITYCPYDLSLINKDMLDSEEIKWINDYHKMVYEKLAPLCDNELKEYLKEATKEIC